MSLQAEYTRTSAKYTSVLPNDPSEGQEQFCKMPDSLLTRFLTLAPIHQEIHQIVTLPSSFLHTDLLYYRRIK